MFLFGSKLKETRSDLGEFGYCVVTEDFEDPVLAVGLGVDAESGFFEGDCRSLPLSSSLSSLSKFAIVFIATLP